ncbi:MAG: YihY family inner membrane protein [Nitrospirae bacterium]|nr:YihY family inner membrane protein [Nitrospirota bacterium]
MINVKKKLTDFFSRGLWEMDTGALGKFKSFLVKSLRLCSVALKEFTEGQLTLRAMGLVYTVILAIVPVLAISFSVLKAFGVHNQIMVPYLLEFLAPLGEKGEEITAKIAGFIENMQVGVLGSLGFVMLIYTFLSVIQKVESAFNYIWMVKRARSFRRRFSDYTSVLLIVPVLIFSAAGLTASFMSHAFVQKLMRIEVFGPFFYLAARVTPYIIISGVFTFLYIFLPNTRVNFRSALFGGVLAGILWQTAGWGFTYFVVSSTQYAAIYSGFAVLVMFMIWLYVSWLILLVGAQISFYHQYPQFLSIKKEVFHFSNRLRERTAVLIMYLISYDYYYGRHSWTLNSLVARLNLPVDAVHDVITLLVRNELLIETGTDPPGYLPARDIENIPLRDIFNAVRIAHHEAVSIEHRMFQVTEVDNIIKRLDDAYIAALGEKTIKDIVISSAGKHQHR